MNCENIICLKEITHGNLVPLRIQKQDIFSGKIQKINMFVSVCNDCIKKYNYEDKVKGEIKILLDK